MDRPVTQEGLDKQIALMTGEMFSAVTRGDKKLFAMALAKGADVTQFNAEGMPLLHAGIKRSIREENLEWLLLVLPHAQDLFVTTAGMTLFDSGLDKRLLPSGHSEYAELLRKCRLRVMQEMPDIEVARAKLAQSQERGLQTGQTLVAPRFNIVGSPQQIDKKTQAPPAPPQGPAQPPAP